jgi:hypothetical protein
MPSNTIIRFIDTSKKETTRGNMYLLAVIHLHVVCLINLYNAHFGELVAFDRQILHDLREKRKMGGAATGQKNQNSISTKDMGRSKEL